MVSKLVLGFASICALQIGMSGFAPPALAESNTYEPYYETMDWSDGTLKVNSPQTESSQTQQPRKIPEPGTVGALLLTGLGIVSSHKKRQLPQG